MFSTRRWMGCFTRWARKRSESEKIPQRRLPHCLRKSSARSSVTQFGLYSFGRTFVMQKWKSRRRSMALQIDVSRTDGTVIVECDGRIVFGEEADELRRVVLGLLNESSQIILNLSRIAYVDSSG